MCRVCFLDSKPQKGELFDGMLCRDTALVLAWSFVQTSVGV